MREVEIKSVATPPRFVVPGQSLHLVVKAVSRQFRFVPRKEVVDSIRFIFWYCVKKYKVAVHDAMWMSNHSHLAVTDVDGVYPKFMCEMNSLISRQLNALGSGEGTNIEKGYTCTEIADDEAMLRTCAYILANPCLADLVERTSDWKGVSTFEREYGVPFVVKRPKCGMWSESPPDEKCLERNSGSRSDARGGSGGWSRRRRKPSNLPEEVEGVLTRPGICLDMSNEELRGKIVARTAYKEKKASAKRKKKKKKVLGWIRAVEEIPTNKPRKRQAIFELKPLVSASAEEVLAVRLDQIRRFRQAYREAWIIYVHESPERAVFPRGTWKMRTMLNARCRV